MDVEHLIKRLGIKHWDVGHGVILLLIALLLFGLFVWPTPYRYDQLGRNSFRINRLTGEVYIQMKFEGQYEWLPCKECEDFYR